MALTNDHDVAVTWSSSSTVTLSSNTARSTSDAITVDPTAFAASLQVKADNQGTPASGDIMKVWVAWSLDGTNFDTEEHAEYLGPLNTVAADDPGEDPATRTFTLNPRARQKLKVILLGPQSASRNIVGSAIYNESRAS